MALSGQRIAALDVGQTATKLVVLERSGGSAKVVKTASFRNRDEGLMDQIEAAEHMVSWLEEQDVADVEFVIGLPQFMAMTQITDFPPVVGSQLQDLVEFETQQLAGLTDEEFIHDYQPLKPYHTYQNPALIAVCRESLIESRVELFEKSEINIQSLFMEGQALLASYLFSHRGAASSDELVLLMDVGAENTTMVVVLNEQILYVSSFLFGGEFFTESLAKHLGVSEIEAERTKFASKLMHEDTDSPLTRTARNLIVELEANLDNWRNHDEAAAKLKISAIHLSGGGALTEGLVDFLHANYHCPVENISHPLLAATADHPESWNIAFGLGLLGLAGPTPKLAANLLPQKLRWESLRRKRMGFLYAALFLLAIVCGSILSLLFLGAQKQHEKLSARTQRLDRCKAIVPDVIKARNAIDRCDLMLRPFVARGNRNIVVVNAIDQISQAKQNGDWMCLLTDYPLSYRDQPDEFVTHSSKSAPTLLGPSNETTGAKGVILTSSCVPWTAIAVSGFTPRRSEFRNVREMIRRLNESNLFERVDANPQLSPLDSQVRTPWLMFGMRPYSLICHLESTEFAPTPKKTNGKAK